MTIYLRAAALVLCLCVTLFTAGQTKPLHIGDKLPRLRLASVLPYKQAPLSLPGGGAQLYLLDFWSTTCSSCIGNMPELQELQEQFGERLQIIGVTADAKETVRRFAASNAKLQAVRFPLIGGDRVLGKLFPHTLLPHEVWIDGGGRVLAITPAEYVTAANIAAVLGGEQPRWPEKQDLVNFNYDAPLLTAHVRPSGTCYTALLPYGEGLDSRGGFLPDSQAGTQRLYYINHDVLHLYAIALGSPWPFYAHRRVFAVRDSSDFVYRPQQGYRVVWNAAHQKSFEAVTRLGIAREVLQRMLLAALNDQLGLTGQIDTLPMPCLLLRRKAGSTVPAADSSRERELVIEAGKTGNHLYGCRTEDLVYELNALQLLPWIIDETGYGGLLDVAFDGPLDQLAALNTALGRSGLELTPTTRALPVFVLSDDIISFTHKN